MSGFRSFILRGNLIDLAVAVVIGSQFSSLVKQFVQSFVDPLLAMVGGTPNGPAHQLELLATPVKVVKPKVVPQSPGTARFCVARRRAASGRAHVVLVQFSCAAPAWACG
jgi:hypothetical protein